MHKSAKSIKKVEQRPHISCLSKIWLLLESPVCVQRKNPLKQQRGMRMGAVCSIHAQTSPSPWKENWPNWPKKKGETEGEGEMVFTNRPSWNKESISTGIQVKKKTYSKPILCQILILGRHFLQFWVWNILFLENGSLS